ncbi:uncharacterized protein ASCRUDRAFT_10107 [Ascoidea rubescens DSM 1968]|uniref:Protein kinase domain-containing protein n=1 Tax=Ascoidea rubescens DSM 1968 TaxID=1344418 RepID=A0A1D2VA91_9ASCO|nr:hypothetical protein ASCRUDRAFT_10107 [Ascoidea rubescens DSM 1968]ODV58509.1 hypothetical protein ASCRUDRAFT_10107 [Ascoidea rubescens DSM 1968]
MRKNAIQTFESFYKIYLKKFIIELEIYNRMKDNQAKFLPKLFCHGFLDGSHTFNTKVYKMFRPFILMEYLKHDKNFIKNGNVKEILAKELEILEEFHKQNVILEDIKLSNIIINLASNGELSKKFSLILDFSNISMASNNILS